MADKKRTKAAKPADDADDGARAGPSIRDAHDAEDHAALKDDPSDENAKLDIALDESFPTSDAPGHSPPGGGEPAASSGYDEQSEHEILKRRERAYALWEQEGRPDGRHDAHWDRAGGEAPEPGTAPWTEGP